MTEFEDGPKPNPDKLNEELAKIAKDGTKVFQSPEARDIFKDIGSQAQELIDDMKKYGNNQN